MKRKLEISELIFKIISYVMLSVFALCCLYPFVYAVSSSISGRRNVQNDLFEVYVPVNVPANTGDYYLVNEDAGIRLKAVTNGSGEIVSAQQIRDDGSTAEVRDAVRDTNGALIALQVRDSAGNQVTDADGAPLYAAVVWYSTEDGISLQQVLDRELLYVKVDAEYLAGKIAQLNAEYALKVAKVRTNDGKPMYTTDKVTLLSLDCEKALAAGVPVGNIIQVDTESKWITVDPRAVLDPESEGLTRTDTRLNEGRMTDLYDRYTTRVSGGAAVAANTEHRGIVLLPKAVQFRAFSWMFQQDVFWNSYSNTLFLTVYGTAWSLVVSILGAYALSKKRLKFRKFFNFFLVFTMWFSAGIVPQRINYLMTKTAFHDVGIMDDKWMVVIAMGMAAMNIILLRNAFENVPGEIEEAAIVDGATEMQVLRQVFIPMSKSTIATVALFFAISRWNGYFWAKQMVTNDYEWPLQVYIRTKLEELVYDPEVINYWDKTYAADSVIYALIVCSIIPILIIYPFIQKYFAKGTNVGGVKE